MSSASPALEDRRQAVIRTPDQRLRVFVSSTLQELAEERMAAKEAILKLRLAPVMFELGARPHPPRNLYRAYLEQSHIFVGIYWQRYGWVAPGETISGLEDEYRLSGGRPKLIYLKTPAPELEPRLDELLDRIRSDDQASYRPFSSAQELGELIENDLALLLTERFELAQPRTAKTTEKRKSNLLVAPTPLIGREEEVAALRELLLQGAMRLVTLSGPGGTGKTRLGLQVAAEVADDFADGVFFVSLAPLSDPHLVVSTIAQTLGVTESGQPPLLGTLKDYLRNKQTLLLLDNFEQIMAAAPLVSELLAACPRLKVLVTSRELLHLTGEQVFPVPPLALPEADTPVEDLLRYPAANLFVQRAQAVKPSFSPSRENASAIAEICIRLDGLPLAIELAAARVKLLSPEAMLARLDNRLALLTSGARDLPTRQQTLKSAIGWSHDLLDGEEKRLFARLSLFVGGWTLEAVEAVCDQDDLSVLEGVTSLLDKNLLRQEQDQAGEPWFIMLQTIQEFARERLEESGEAEATQHAHAEYFLALAEEAEPHLRGAAQAAWLGRLEVEHGNLRSALAWAERNGEVDFGLRLAGSLWRFWYGRGYLSEGRGWLARILAQGGTVRTAARAKALHGAGVLAHSQGDHPSARSLFEESLAIGRELGDGRGVAQSLNSLGIMAYEQGDYALARSLHEEGLEIRRSLGDKQGLAHSLLNLGNIASDQGDYVLARSLYEESLAVSRELGDKGSVVNALLNLGNLAYDEGGYVRARQLFEESLAISRELGDKGSVAHSLGSLGNVLIDQGDYAHARVLFEESLAIRQELGDRRGAASSLLNLGIIAHEQGDYASARSLYRESLAILRDLGDKWRVLYLLEAFAALRVVEDEPEQAARLFGAAEALREAIGAPMPPPECPKYERNVEAARAKLEEERFTAAWAGGRTMTLDQAAIYALESSGSA
jgi:predicted ATPase/Tfp pilus assembly protein PilF